MCIKYADYIIRKYNSDKNQTQKLTNKRLQKILFVASVKYSLENNGKQMFSDNFEAWSYGPVIPDIYKEYSFFQSGYMFPLYPENEKIEKDKEIALQEALKLTKNISTKKLIENAHIKGSPWDFYYEKNYEQQYQVIPYEKIYKYYKNVENYNKLIEE